MGLLSMLLSVTSMRAAEPPVVYGFDAMEHPELLPFFLPNGTQTKQFITYDPEGKNQSGFFKRYESNGEYVFFDDIGLEPWTKETFYRSRIRITWDNQAAPAVDMPLGSFFGAGGDTIGVEDVSGRTLKTLFFGFDANAKQFYCHWPMPFWSRAHVQIVNDSPTPLTRVGVEVNTVSPETLCYPAGACGYFRAHRTIDISPDKSLYSRAFQERGRGKVVGLVMYSTGYNMDGDEFTFIDGSLTPQIHGDGTEDDHNQGWGGYAIQTPLCGGLINGFQGGYRLYTGEPYLFDSSITIKLEHVEAQPANSNNEYYYWVHCYGRTPFN